MDMAFDMAEAGERALTETMNDDVRDLVGMLMGSESNYVPVKSKYGQSKFQSTVLIVLPDLYHGIIGLKKLRRKVPSKGLDVVSSPNQTSYSVPTKPQVSRSLNAVWNAGSPVISRQKMERKKA